MNGKKVASALKHARRERRPLPESITVDNGSEFSSKCLDPWAVENGVMLAFIRPRRPVENGFIESFNGRLRDEFLNVELLFSLTDAQNKLAGWRKDFNHARPHSALADRTPSEFAALWKEEAISCRGERFAPKPFDTACGKPGQGFAPPAIAALDPASHKLKQQLTSGRSTFQRAYAYATPKRITMSKVSNVAQHWVVRLLSRYQILFAYMIAA
jgi:hypothetical protein